MSDPRPALDAVVFDAGGTLVRLDFEWMASAVTALGFPLEAAVLRRAEVEGRRRYDASTELRQAALAASGRSEMETDDGPEQAPLGVAGDIGEYFAGMLDAAAVPASLQEPAATAFRTRERTVGLWTRPMEGARAALDGVAALGLRCAVVSNSDGRAEWHLEHSDVLRGVEFVVDSQRVGVEKPDPEIFRIALRRLRLPAERVLYVGDIRSVDERGALSAGLHFVLVDPYRDYGMGVPAIGSMDQLPDWIASHFEASRAAGGGAS